MVEATIEDLAFTNRSSRVTIWGHPHIVGEAVLSTTKIFTGAKPFLKADIKPSGITEIGMLPPSKKVFADVRTISKTWPSISFLAPTQFFF
jgi:hypothetical protein